MNVWIIYYVNNILEDVVLLMSKRTCHCDGSTNKVASQNIFLKELRSGKILQELWIRTKNAWENIHLPRCRALVDSMHSRCAEVIKNRGGAT